jgi:hypothetical protein
MNSVKVAVSPPEQFDGFRRLWNAIGELYSLEFEPRAVGDTSGCAAALLFGVADAVTLRVAQSGVPCMVFPAVEEVAVPSINAPLCLGSAPPLARCLQGRTFRDQSVTRIHRLTRGTGEQALITKGEDVLWICMPAGQSFLHRTALRPPDLRQDEYLYQYFQRDNCMRLLPLLHFVRDVGPWKRPRLRACLMFDDPNLHWRTYGYINFAQLVDHARAHNYHAAFATVPFDGWYVHRATAALFRANQDRLSLLIHGNDHTYAELARDYVNGDSLALAAQALRRIEKLEQRSGFEVSRVMAAPHGGCSAQMANSLAQVGFEAATISRWSLMNYNRTKWYSTIGLNIAEFLGDAFPIIPRFKLAYEREVDIYLAALMEKPIIVVGHHDDLRDGLGIMADFAQRINSVGDVSWVDMKDMARSNFCQRAEGDALHVKMYSRRIQVIVPEGIAKVVVHRPWLGKGHVEQLQWRVNRGPWETGSSSVDSIATHPGQDLEIRTMMPNAWSAADISSPSRSFWPAARRGFCELRDRLNRSVLS